MTVTLSFRHEQVISKTYNTRSFGMKVLTMMKTQLTILEIQQSIHTITACRNVSHFTSSRNSFTSHLVSSNALRSQQSSIPQLITLLNNQLHQVMRQFCLLLSPHTTLATCQLIYDTMILSLKNYSLISIFEINQQATFLN